MVPLRETFNPRKNCFAGSDQVPAREVSHTVSPSCHLVVMRAVLRQARPCSIALNGLQPRKAASLEFQVELGLLPQHPHLGSCRVWLEHACAVCCGTVDLRVSCKEVQ